MQELSSDEMYGIAKKFNRECEAFPMHTHSAIVEMVRVGMQHRNLKMQAEQNAKQADLQERAMKAQEQQMELARMAAQREAAETVRISAGAKVGPSLVKDPGNGDEPQLLGGADRTEDATQMELAEATN